MADEIDQAQAINEQFLTGVLADHALRQPNGESSTHCEDCHQPIPEGRRKAARGCSRCVTCQEAFEIHSHWRAL